MTSVLIPAYNGAHIVDRTVPAVLAMEGVDEWVWVDDGSTDRTAPAIQQLIEGEPRARLIQHATNQGRGAARNTAVRESRGLTLVFLDVDALPQVDTVVRLHEALAPTGVIAVTGRVKSVIDRPEDPYQRYLARYPRGAPPVSPKETLDWRFFLTCVCAVTRAAFDRAGGFDPSIAYGEDFALACRLRQQAPAGLRLAATTVDLFDAATLDGALENVAAFGRALRAIESSCPDALTMTGVPPRWLGPRGALVAQAAGPVLNMMGSLRAIPGPLQPWTVRYVLGLTLLSAYHGARPRPS
jgi:glycosyltransferase involved in cell wall biosynthesis